MGLAVFGDPHLRPFQKVDDRSFFTLPQSSRQGVSVATTCTALMALIDSNRLPALFGDDPSKPKPKDVFSAVVRGTWESSGLKDLNAFTTCMVIRAAGFLVSAGVISSAEAKELKHVRPNLDALPPGAHYGLLVC